MKNLYTIYDTVAEAIGPIVTYPSDAPAVRMFGDVASDPNNNISRHLDDFELLCLGMVDDHGLLHLEEVAPRVVITGAAWKSAQTPAEAPVNG